MNDRTQMPQASDKDAIQLANRQALANYIVRLNTHLQAYDGVNPFWREITDSFRSKFVPPADASRANDDVDAVLAWINAMPKTGYFIQPISAQQSAAAWAQILADAADPNAVRDDKARHEAAIVASFLVDLGLLDEAKATIDAIRIEPKYVTLRHFYYFTQLRETIARSIAPGRPLNALEIGAGGSTLKLFLKHHFGERLRSYVIVDLPEMLCLSIKAAVDFFPAEELQIVDANELVDPGKPSVFVPADLTAAVPRAPMFDLFLNTHSFQEMDAGVIASYFRLIYGSARNDAIFFQTNLVQQRMTRLDGSRFVNDPAQYPFRPTDKVIFCQEDPFHVYARDRFGYKRTPTLTSIRTIPSREEVADPQCERAYLARLQSTPWVVQRVLEAFKRRVWRRAG
jgi:putative sugar O-methyltransferase